MNDAKPIGHYTERIVARLKAQRGNFKLLCDRHVSDELAVLPALVYASDWRWAALYFQVWNFRLGFRWRTV